MSVHTFVLSDETINEYGFIVKTEGIDISGFEKNPVMLYNHQGHTAIGRWTNIRKENNQLLADAEFDMQDEDAAKFAGKVERGFLKGASIGIPYRTVVAERQIVGDKEVAVVVQCALNEASVCPLPANSNALALYDDGGEMMDAKKITLSIESLVKPVIEPKPQSQSKMEKINLSAANMAKLNLSENATQDEVNAAVASLVAENETYKASAEAQLKLSIDQMVDAAITDGRIKGEQRETFVALATKDFDGTKKVLDSLNKPADPRAGLSSDAKSGEERKDWTLSDWRKKDPQGFLELKSSNPDEYKRILAADGSSKHMTA